MYTKIHPKSPISLQSDSSLVAKTNVLGQFPQPCNPMDHPRLPIERPFSMRSLGMPWRRWFGVVTRQESSPRGTVTNESIPEGTVVKPMRLSHTLDQGMHEDSSQIVGDDAGLARVDSSIHNRIVPTSTGGASKS
jgi:hypothetical protein